MMTSLQAVAAPLRVLVFALAVGVVVWLIKDVLLLGFFAALLAVLLHGLASRLAPYLRVSNGVTLALIVILLLAALGLGIYLAGPAIASQAEQLYGTVIQQGEALQDHYGHTTFGRWLIAHLTGSNSFAGHPALLVAGSTMELLVDMAVLVISALYLASSPQVYVNGLVLLLPLSYRARGREILEQSGRTLWGWLIGQGIDMLVVGTLATAGFLIVGVPLPFMLGILTGVLTFIPYVGPFLSAVPSALSGLTVGLSTAMYALAVLLVCHLVEGYVVAPLVQRRMVHVPPALTVLALAVSASLFGILGAIMGTPLTAVLLVIVQQGYIADVLGDTEMRESSRRRG